MLGSAYGLSGSLVASAASQQIVKGSLLKACIDCQVGKGVRQKVTSQRIPGKVLSFTQQTGRAGLEQGWRL